MFLLLDKNTVILAVLCVLSAGNVTLLWVFPCVSIQSLYGGGKGLMRIGSEGGLFSLKTITGSIRGWPVLWTSTFRWDPFWCRFSVWMPNRLNSFPFWTHFHFRAFELVWIKMLCVNRYSGSVLPSSSQASIALFFDHCSCTVSTPNVLRCNLTSSVTSRLNSSANFSSIKDSPAPDSSSTQTFYRRFVRGSSTVTYPVGKQADCNPRIGIDAVLSSARVWCQTLFIFVVEVGVLFWFSSSLLVFALVLGACFDEEERQHLWQFDTKNFCTAKCYVLVMRIHSIAHFLLDTDISSAMSSTGQKRKTYVWLHSTCTWV